MIRLIFAVAITLTLITSFVSGQEICNNNIDDDGNGLIDHLDPACEACYGYIFGTIAEDFEDFSCCPEDDAQTFCINGWQSTAGTTDYFNTCDYLGGDNKPLVPLPIPSGNGVIGIATWAETIGTCLDNNLVAGESYDISFYTGFNTSLDLLSSLNVEFSLFGATNCSSMFDANCFGPTWFEIASFNVIGDQDSSWVYFSSNFTTSVDISAIAIGHSCAFLETIPPHNYHFIDDIEITGFLGPLVLLGDVPEITFTGDCIDGIYIETDIADATSYQWYLNGETITGAVTNPYPIESSQLGTYQVSVFDDLGCNLISDPLLVDTEIEVLNINGEIIHLNCYFEYTGSIDVNVAEQNNSPLTYAWSIGATSEDLENIAAGNYTVTVTDANGCFGIMDFTVNSPDPFINTLVVIQPNMGNPGSATVTTTGGLPQYTYLWSNGNTTNSDDDLAPGAYSITVTDENGCEEIFEFVITADFFVNASSTEVSCFGSCNGTISLVVDGPDVTYSVVWDDANLDGFMPSNVCAGTYNYLVMDDVGSSLSGTVTISEPDEIIISAFYQNSICDISESTTIALVVSGGTIPYAYTWTNGSNTDTLFNAGVGSHSATVTDYNDCMANSTFEVDTFQSLNLSFVTSLAGCNGEPDGTIDLNISGGLIPFSYNWNDGSTTEDLIDLTPGIYTVTVTDSNTCTAIGSVEVNADSGIEVSASVSNINCADLDDGSIYLDILGGTDNLDIQWNIAYDSNYIYDLSPGIYSVTITNENGCTWNQSYILSLHSDLNITAEIEDESCFQDQEGSINIQIGNSNSLYTILWNNGSTDEDLFNISAGQYEFSLIDSFGCEYNYTYDVDEGLEILYSSSTIEPGCNGSSDGSIIISPISGSFPLSYLWSTGDITYQISNIQAGAYFLTITDNEGCTKMDTFLLSEDSTIEVNENIVHNSCHGDSQGQINIGISGGIQPYEINWSNNSNSNTISNLAAGTYIVSITDAVGCEINQIYIVNDPESLGFIGDIALPLCHDDLGTISVEGFGGIEPYSILWSTGATSSTINIEPGNNYEVTLTDINNCLETLDFSIDQIFEIDIAVLSVTETGPSNNTGEITIEVTGGTLPYQIVWNDGQIGTIASGLGYGAYMVEIVDANGCTAQLTIIIDYNTPLTLQSSMVHNLCFGDCNGSVDLDVSGGNLPYIITWSDGKTTTSATGLCVGTYQATVVDATGSEIITKEFVIQGATQINIDGQVFDISCVGIDDGQIEVDASGGTMPFTYTWNNGMIEKDVNNLSPGTYQVTVIDENDCINSSDFTLNNIPIVDLELDLKDFNCDEEFTSIEIIGDNIYDYPIYINDTKAILDESGYIRNLTEGSYTLSYKINETCVILIEDLEIINPNETQLHLNIQSVDIRYGKLQELTLEITNELLPIGFTIDWEVVNEYECIESYQEGQCRTILITAKEDEVLEVTFTDFRCCTQVLTAVLKVDKTTYVYVPNVFSPNGDGINDVFEITSNYLDMTVNQFMIYDRWGNTVYSQQNKQLSDLLPWNGLFGDSEVSNGVYVYLLELTTKEGEPIIKAGDITLIK